MLSSYTFTYLYIILEQYNSEIIYRYNVLVVYNTIIYPKLCNQIIYIIKLKNISIDVWFIDLPSYFEYISKTLNNSYFRKKIVRFLLIKYSILFSKNKKIGLYR